MFQRLALFLFLWAGSVHAQESLDEVREVSKRIVPEKFDEWTDDRRMSWLATALKSTQKPVELYVFNRLLFFENYRKNEVKAAADICQAMKPLPDDLGLRLNCLDVMEGDIPHEELRHKIVDIIETAQRLKRNDAVVDALGSLAWIQSEDGDITEALASYERALELVPKEDERTRFNVLFNLATNYIIHGNNEYIDKGIGLLKEIKTRGAERSRDGDPEAAQFLADSRLAAFNIGIAYTLHRFDYEKALPEFEYAKAMGESSRVEALTFASLAASELGRYDQARQLIAEIKGEESRFPIKEGYLKCYRALTVRHWDRQNSLAPCFQLHADTPLEVVSDINKRLARLKGQPEELDGLRSYVKMYEEKIEPEYRKRVARAASHAEVKRLEGEAKLKDEKIALGERIKILLYVVLLISLLLLGLMLVVLRSRRIIKTQARDIEIQKQNLQHVLDNIDEGILAINRQGQISSVYSRHASQILQKTPTDMDIPDLLACIGLEGDAQAAAHEVFRAVLGEDPLVWELNSGLLPHSGYIHGAPFQFYWTPIITHDRVTEVLLSIRDAAATLALQKEARARARILSVVNAGALGHNFIWDLDNRLNAVRQGLTRNGSAQSLRLAHTMKGEARSLGFSDLQDQLHHLEQAVLQERFTDAAQIMDGIQSAAAALQETFEMIKGGQRKGYGNPVLGFLQTVLADAHKRLREVGIELISDLHLNWIELRDEEVAALRDILIHGVANSIDHGYLLAKRRNQAVEDTARLSIQLHVKGDDIHFAIIDHGVGIDWKALEEIARKRNWTPPKDCNLADIVFEDRVSTVAEIQVSKTSGRGIGMAAVAEAVKSLQGSIKFGPGFNHRGARLDIRWTHMRARVPARNPVAS